MRVQRVDRARVRARLVRAVPGNRERRVGGEEPPDDFGFAVPPVVQYDQQPGQALDNLSGIPEERLGYHDSSPATDSDQVSIS